MNHKKLTFKGCSLEILHHENYQWQNNTLHDKMGKKYD
jgi:hypothetical protein